MKVETFKCDICKKMRVDDSNHWLAGWENNEVFPVVALTPFPVSASMDWVTVFDYEPDVHLCGQECAQRWLSEAVRKVQRHDHHSPAGRSKERVG